MEILESHNRLQLNLLMGETVAPFGFGPRGGQFFHEVVSGGEKSKVCGTAESCYDTEEVRDGK